MDIKEFFIHGERCSGTSYMETLIPKNFHIIQNKKQWKHGFYIDKYIKNMDEKALHIVITRNAYDWSKSFFEKKYDVGDSMKRCNYSEFIRVKYVAKVDGYKNTYEMMEECDEYCNIMKMRTAKLKNLYDLRKKVKYIEYVRLEDIEKDYLKFLEMIYLKYGLKKRNLLFVNIATHTKSRQEFKGSKKHELNINDIQFINENLDWNIEALYGYSKKIKVS